MVRVFDDAEALVVALAERIADRAAVAIASRGVFRLALSGGDSPKPVYRKLGTAYRDRIDWRRVIIGFADERAVPPDHPDSNYRLVRETLLEPLGVTVRVRRMEGEAADLEMAARAYEADIAEPIDLLLLGVGPDGHTASIFPNSAAVDELERRVVAVWDSPKPPPRRITITPRVIREARETVVLVRGAEKATVVAGALEGEADPHVLPARLLRTYDWYVDRQAASQLEGTT
jgi:6-phosphogluconolactonase